MVVVVSVVVEVVAVVVLVVAVVVVVVAVVVVVSSSCSSCRRDRPHRARRGLVVPFSSPVCDSRWHVLPFARLPCPLRRGVGVVDRRAVADATSWLVGQSRWWG